ncbi:MAG TPA: YegP family protein [Pyrinomonadaceae bacterium]|jgi:uncharacterized protein YegP (UPF0339 family)|nr:YegP family protein [Pyrinomonadaceae bacterium]
MAGKYELKKSASGKYHFNLKAGNGQVILSSEMYETKAAANNGIESVRKNGGDDKNFDRKTATNGQFYFNLKAANGQVIGKSEMYNTADARDNGIESVKTNCSSTTVDDLTGE